MNTLTRGEKQERPCSTKFKKAFKKKAVESSHVYGNQIRHSMYCRFRELTTKPDPVFFGRGKKQTTKEKESVKLGKRVAVVEEPRVWSPKKEREHLLGKRQDTYPFIKDTWKKPKFELRFFIM